MLEFINKKAFSLQRDILARYSELIVSIYWVSLQQQQFWIFIVAMKIFQKMFIIMTKTKNFQKKNITSTFFNSLGHLDFILFDIILLVSRDSMYIWRSILVLVNFVMQKFRVKDIWNSISGEIIGLNFGSIQRGIESQLVKFQSLQ